MTHLLKKDTPFIFSKECIESFNILKKKLTESLILVAPNWDLPFEIMCDASDYAVGAVLGKHCSREQGNYRNLPLENTWLWLPFCGDTSTQWFADIEKLHARNLEYLENSSNAITPDLPTEEPDNSLSMGYEHLSTIPETESDKLKKSSVENLVLIPNISTVSHPKIDYLLEEFYGELTHINLIPPGIKEADFDPEEEICLIKELLYDNSTPRPPKESNSEISDATIESFSPSPIPVEDSDSLMEEIDLFLNSDDSIPPGIENEDYDSQGDILYLEELLSNDSLSLPETESFHFDHYDIPSSPRPPAINDLKIMDCPDFEDSRARGFVHRPLDLQSFACLYMGIRYRRSY
ncbi:ribonuclease H-like domain-containing protein [Tanacetum coccineum]